MKLREPGNVVIWLWDTRWNDEIYYFDDRRILQRCFSLARSSVPITLVYDGRGNVHYVGLPRFSHGLVVHSPSANIGGSLKRFPLPWHLEPWARNEIEDLAVWHGYDRELTRNLLDIAGGAIHIHVDSITSAAKQRKIYAGD